jgi:phosphatidylserine/phosphatidylglycerophosphate/cardiolipin synthase-like enzyme
MLGLALLLAGAGCAVLAPARISPFRSSAQAPDDPVMARYEALLRAVLAGYDADRLRHLAGLDNGETGPVPRWIRPEVAKADQLAASMAEPVIAPLAGGTAGPRSYDGRWRQARSYLYLSGEARAWDRPFRFSGLNALESRVLLRSADRRRARITASCDGPATLAQDSGRTAVAAGGRLAFVLLPHSRDEVQLILPEGTDVCTLTVRYDAGPDRLIRLEREETADADLAALDSRFDVCAVPRPERMDALERAFFASRWLSQTCATEARGITFLPDAHDGFNAKVEALLGRPLPDKVFENGDPTVPLGVGKAPHLSMIVLSYLDLKADFSGFLMERMLRFHAARGTLVRILVTDVLERPKDRALYEGLAADFPNVQLQFYDWSPGRLAPAEEWFSALHRVHHVKLFATLSPEPGASRAILGGRNIHDGFLFAKALDLKRFPWLQSYGKPGETSLNYFASYEDFEVSLSDPAMVRSLVAHLSTFWHRDPATTVYRPFSLAVEEAQPGAVPLRGARHFLSVPFLDGNALEDLWVDLIDSARVQVKIVTPYLNPTPRIEAALNRAVRRGVDVTIVARIRLDGDLGGRLMTEMNMLFVERYAGHFTLWEYDPPDVVLHSKILLVDHRLAVVTSTNLNRRSFLHDTENGLMVLDRTVAQGLEAEVQRYIDRSRRCRPGDVAVRPISRLLFDMPRVRDLF